MTYNVFGGTLNLAQSINQSVYENTAVRQQKLFFIASQGLKCAPVCMKISGRKPHIGGSTN